MVLTACSDVVITCRMHQDIMSWPSEFLYDNLLEADSSVASHLLRSVCSGHIHGVLSMSGFKATCSLER